MTVKGTSIVDEKTTTGQRGGQRACFVTDMSNSPALYAVDDNMQRICRID